MENEYTKNALQKKDKIIKIQLMLLFFLFGLIVGYFISTIKLTFQIEHNVYKYTQTQDHEDNENDDDGVSLDESIEESSNN